MSKKQSVCGLKVTQFQVKKGKETERLRLILEADISDVTAGEYDVGEVLKSLLVHQSANYDVGFSLLVSDDDDDE